ncbi:hypothetical protein [Streptomyces silvisoli]|uniref:Uncharacterized protein n=1 Tax=Streptomyces silvisoli TaxID=3034235 RepID=A0ABT5ZR52_9ACTN|nr:hypothetical protein [Streptomyces silvisoli]MDF3292288.1 hypothetical protein [Streptomyces silvisoli]
MKHPEHSDTRITRRAYQSAFPEVTKKAGAATTKLAPLQLKAEAKRTEGGCGQGGENRNGPGQAQEAQGLALGTPLTHRSRTALGGTPVIGRAIPLRKQKARSAGI